MKEIRQDQQDNQDCFVCFRFPDETGNTQSASPARRDDPSYLTAHYGGPPRWRGMTDRILSILLSGADREKATEAVVNRAPTSHRRRIACPVKYEIHFTGGSWLLLPATAEDNKKIHSIL
jgi:hypothetical protein